MSLEFFEGDEATEILTQIFSITLISALFTVLRMSTIDMREIEDEAELSHRAKYAELVMKVDSWFSLSLFLFFSINS